jgi:phosphohistidine phosphatase
MKTLLLMKHAESIRINKQQDDWYRPLSENGIMDAYLMGELLVAENLVPDLILTSSAVRAHQTARIIANVLDHPCDLCRLDNLYMAEMGAYFNEIQRLPDKINHLLVIGHSPSLNRILQVVTEIVAPIPFSSVAYVNVSINAWKDFRYDVQGDLVRMFNVDQIPIKDCGEMARVATLRE